MEPLEELRQVEPLVQAVDLQLESVSLAVSSVRVHLARWRVSLMGHFADKTTTAA